jgi:uncharacterized NAD-dependent epimerase/dehydratase family protein
MLTTKKTALVYCENQFGLVDGKTAAGLIRQSETYEIVGVIDSSSAGKDAGVVLGGKHCNIPIFANLAAALCNLNAIPDSYIYGKAPLEAYIPITERLLILEAIQKGMNIVNGLHQFFSDDWEFAEMAAQYGVKILDIRKPPKLNDLHVFTGQIARVTVPVIAVLGTDCACGKMTTAVELDRTLNAMGIKSVMVATGQTSLMQGAKYGASLDALVSQFAIGEVEHAVLQAFDHESPDIILVEGQSSVSHPAFMSSISILKGSLPDGIILQHPPARQSRCDFPHLPMPTIEREISLIEAISPTKVIAITLSHEGLSKAEIPALIADYEQRFQLPTTDVLTDGCQKLIQALGDRFPKLAQAIAQKTAQQAMGAPLASLSLEPIPLKIPSLEAIVLLTAAPSGTQKPAIEPTMPRLALR